MLAAERAKKKERTAARIIQAIRDTNGLLTLAAQRAGFTYITIWRYAREYPSVAQAVVEAKEKLLDFAESKLYENIKAGDNIAILFFLKTKGKARGYIERQEVEHSGNIGLKPEELTDAELVSIVSGNGRRGTIKAPVGPSSAN